jgi:hypothetical protein
MFKQSSTILGTIVFFLAFIFALQPVRWLLTVEQFHIPVFTAGMLAGIWSMWFASIVFDRFERYRQRCVKRHAEREAARSDLE